MFRTEYYHTEMAIEKRGAALEFAINFAVTSAIASLFYILSSIYLGFLLEGGFYWTLNVFIWPVIFKQKVLFTVFFIMFIGYSVSIMIWAYSILKSRIWN
jgi:hypothetical protein